MRGSHSVISIIISSILATLMLTGPNGTVAQGSSVNFTCRITSSTPFNKSDVRLTLNGYEFSSFMRISTLPDPYAVVFFQSSISDELSANVVQCHLGNVGSNPYTILIADLPTTGMTIHALININIAA